MQDHRKIAVWHRAQAFAIRLEALIDRWRPRGTSVLRNQMRRAAESIPDNIAEGCGTATNREFARFLQSSVASTRELQGQLDRAKLQGLIQPAIHADLEAELIEIRKMTCGLLKRVREN